MRLGLTLGVVLMMAGGAAAQTLPAGAEERWFTTEGVSDLVQLCNERRAVEVTPETAERMFEERGRRLQVGWDRLLPAGWDEKVAGARSVPGGMEIVRLKDAPAQAVVGRFSGQELVIRISRAAGYHLDHDYDENLATVKVRRTAKLDAIFNLPELTDRYAAGYKGIMQGDTREKMVAALGKPYFSRGAQAVSVEWVYYDGVEIFIYLGKVQSMKRMRKGDKVGSGDFW